MKSLVWCGLPPNDFHTFWVLFGETQLAVNQNFHFLSIAMVALADSFLYLQTNVSVATLINYTREWFTPKTDNTV